MRSRRASWLVLGLALAPLLAVLLASLAGCQRPIPTPPPPPPDGMAVCPAGTAPTTSDVCEGMFAGPGDPCVNCGSVGPCFDQAHAVYCAAPGGCARDPLCKIDAAGTMKARRRSK